jgi:hypothetical protein
VVDYQQGELFGYEIREYILEKWSRRCSYRGTENIPLQIERIVPKANEGTDMVSNLTLAGQERDQKKRDLGTFLNFWPISQIRSRRS